MLTAREAIELSVAFPYACGRRQLPLGERESLLMTSMGHRCISLLRDTLNQLGCRGFLRQLLSPRPQERTPNSFSIGPLYPHRDPEVMR